MEHGLVTAITLLGIGVLRRRSFARKHSSESAPYRHEPIWTTLCCICNKQLSECSWWRRLDSWEHRHLCRRVRDRQGCRCSQVRSMGSARASRAVADASPTTSDGRDGFLAKDRWNGQPARSVGLPAWLPARPHSGASRQRSVRHPPSGDRGGKLPPQTARLAVPPISLSASPGFICIRASEQRSRPHNPRHRSHPARRYPHLVSRQRELLLHSR